MDRDIFVLAAQIARLCPGAPMWRVEGHTQRSDPSMTALRTEIPVESCMTPWARKAALTRSQFVRGSVGNKAYGKKKSGSLSWVEPGGPGTLSVSSISGLRGTKLTSSHYPSPTCDHEREWKQHCFQACYSTAVRVLRNVSISQLTAKKSVYFGVVKTS